MTEDKLNSWLEKYKHYQLSVQAIEELGEIYDERLSKQRVKEVITAHFDFHTTEKTKGIMGIVKSGILKEFGIE